MAGGGLRVEGVWRPPSGEEYVLFFEVPRAQARWVTRRADPFVVAFLLAMMKTGLPVRVRGEVTRRTLVLLAEYQRLMARLHPGLLQVVDIQADTVGRPRRHPREPQPLLAYSGGTDSMFSAWSWTQPERHHNRLAWAVMAHGFDVGQDEHAQFARQFGTGQAALAMRGVNLFAVRTNSMWMSGILGLRWGVLFHGPATAALLLLFQDRFDLGVISSTYVCDNVLVPWGSTPVTDPLLGSGDMNLLHYGSAYDRALKLKALLAWPEGLAHMRVCWQWPREADNCGRCYKCVYVRTLLTLLGCPEATPFPGPFTPDLVRNLDLEDGNNVVNWIRMLELGQTWSPGSPWLEVIRDAVQRGIATFGVPYGIKPLPAGLVP